MYRPTGNNRIISVWSLCRLLSLFVILFLSACEPDKPATEVAWKTVTLPSLPPKGITLRVAHVINPRFSTLSEAQLQKVLAQARRLVREHFGLALAFDVTDAPDIQTFFDYLPAVVKAQRKTDIVDIRFISTAVKQKMQASIYQTLLNYRGREQQVMDYARPYLVHPPEKNSVESLAAALRDTLIQRLQYWQSEKAADGLPVLDGSMYNEWVWWDSMGYGDMPYDIVVTNQLVASAELYGMDVHSSLRGGITAGTTTYSKRGKTGAYAFVMLYPMLNDNAMLAKLRDDASYSEEQIVRYAAALLTHEIGHLLLHLGHPFGNAHCIMSPTPLLKYRQWYEGLDAAQCKLGSEAAMTPGAAKLEYNPQW